MLTSSSGEINIEGDQWIARADDRGSRRAKFAGTKIRLAVWIGFNFNFEAFILTLADIFKIGIFGTSSRRFIQVDGDAELASDTLTQPLGNRNALFHADIATAARTAQHPSRPCADARPCAGRGRSVRRQS